MILLALASAVTTMQADDAGTVPDQQGPPREDLLRARERFSSILCRDADRAAQERILDQRYGDRMRAVDRAVAARFGEAEANRGYITVQTCLAFDTDDAFERAWQSARIQFERVLRDYERRYGLVMKRGDQ